MSKPLPSLKESVVAMSDASETRENTHKSERVAVRLTPIRKRESRALDVQDAASILRSTRLPAHAAHGVDMALRPGVQSPWWNI